MHRSIVAVGRLGVIVAGVMIAGLGSAQTPQIPKIPDLSPSVQDRFLRADTDHSGGLNRVEATAAGYADENFDAIDIDHDHIITLYEIGVFLAKRSSDWERADTNGDGVVTREEAEKVPSLAKIFTRADHDGDGVVRKQEQETFSESTLYRDVDLPYVVPNIINKKF